MRRHVFRIAWRALMYVAAIVVLVDHRAAIRDLSIPVGDVWNRWMVYSRTAEHLVTSTGLRRLQPLVVR